jgi:hypothetical protein
MKLELTVEQVSTLHLAILSRIQVVKKLMKGWEEHPNEFTPKLMEAYTEELRILEETEKIVL